MPNELLSDIARRYCVNDLPGSIRLHTRLQKILDAIYHGKPLSHYALEFLAQQGLHALPRFALGELPYDHFHELALMEQSIRVQREVGVQRARAAEERIREEQVRADRRAWEAEERLREEQRRAWEAEERLKEEQRRAHAERQRQLEEAARLEWESDPAHQVDRKLCKNYGINIDLYYMFNTYQYPNRLISILKKIDMNQRLEEEDLVWLTTVGRKYFLPKLRMAYHRLEADFLARDFQQTRNPWDAINASSHYRKCNGARDADSLLSTIKTERLPPKIQSALYTTHGGALRDLNKLDEALHLGERAHTLQPQDYRPCTLLGAIYMEKGAYSLGQAWYAKAIERGAKVDDVDRDILTILARLSQPRRTALEKFLRQDDPTRWARIENRRCSLRQRK